MDAVCGQSEEPAVLHHKKLSLLKKDFVVLNRLAHINRTRETSHDATIGVPYGVPDHLDGTPAVGTLCDWLESDGIPVESPSLKNRKAVSRCPTPSVYQLHAIG